MTESNTPDDRDTTPTDMFTDSVRPESVHDVPLRNENRYTDPESPNKADDTDARGLFRPSTINEIRY